MSSEGAASGSTDVRSPAASDAPRRLRRGLRIVGLPLFASAAAVTILVTFFQTTFLINDDATLTSLVNGDYTGKRTSSLVISPALFGHIVRLGYAVFPHLPWYGIGLYALQIVAWAVIGITAFTLERRPPLAERVVVGAAIVALAPWMILRVSFTPTSLLLGAVAIVAFAATSKIRGRRGDVYTLLSGSLLGAVYLVRVYSFLGVVIVFAPVLVLIALKAGLRRSAAFALAVGVFVLLGFGTNRLEYSRSADWRAFMKTNSARSSLHDTPRLADRNVSAGDLARIGWTRNDLHLFADFAYPDPKVYSDHAIRTLASLSPRVRDNVSAHDVFEVLKGPAVALLVLVAAVLALRWDTATGIAAGVALVWFVAVLVALMLYVRLPSRVLTPLELGAVFIAAAVPAYLTDAPPRTNPRRLWKSQAVVALVTVLAILPVWHGVRSVSGFDRGNERVVQAMHRRFAKLEAFDPNGVFVARGDFFGDWADPLTAASPFANPRIVPLGWATNSPLFTTRLARLGIHDLYTSLRTNPHVYLLATKPIARAMALFYRQHRGVTVKFVQVRSRVLGLIVWSAARR